MNKKFKLNCVPCGGCCVTPSEQKHLNFLNDSELSEIDIDVTAIESISVENCQNLTKIDCLYNELKDLKIVNCPNITSINCYNNFLSNLDILELENLTFLDCSFNLLAQRAIDDILYALVKHYKSNGTLVIDGDGNARPSDGGLEYISVLIHNGWKIVYNQK